MLAFDANTEKQLKKLLNFVDRRWFMKLEAKTMQKYLKINYVFV